MGNVVGSLRKVTLDGTTFDVFSDTNISETGSAYENEGIPTSGRTMRKMTKRIQVRENVVIACNGEEREIIEELADRLDDFPMSYETAGGDVYRTVGFINFDNRETENEKATIKMIPRDKWEPFLSA